jgi:formylglycine-generating enzyme required for sulfatase activity
MIRKAQPKNMQLNKMKFAKNLRFLSILFCAASALGPRAWAQTPPGLNLQLYAGLSITGAVGTVYSLEYVTDLAQTNSWRCLEFVQPPASLYLWIDRSAPATGRRFYRAQVFAGPTNFVFIPPGTFMMGSPSNEVDREPIIGIVEGPQTAVTISKGFWMEKYQVTQREYLAVIGTNPSGNLGLGNPVETVSWFDATNYCAKLTQSERAAGRISTNCGYRLPTEAEWEYACRAWTSTRFSYGDDLGYSDLTLYAWYDANSGGTTHPVGEKLPNPWGLYDMSGNVAEWCQDWYSPYSGGTALDPQGPATGSAKTLRGGLYFRPSSYCRSAWRNGLSPDLKGAGGFRVVLSSGQP